MLEELYAIHNNVTKNIPVNIKRYLFKEINWKAKAICISGARGVGKTTLLLQYYLEKYSDNERCLYLSADNINVISFGLYKIAREYFKYGGEALIIDEIHKYPAWSLELKNIIDTYKDKQILIAGNSSLDLKKGKYNLSRRIVYHELNGLSFREYLNFEKETKFPAYHLEEILQNHVKYANQLSYKFPMLKHFKEYLQTGYYPYFLEGKDDYINKVLNVIEKVLFEDIAVTFNIRQPKLPILKKILWLISSSHPFIPNIDRMSRQLHISKEYIYNYLEYLELSGLIITLKKNTKASKLVKKPGKIYLENTNLINSITGSIKINGEVGTIRETFFANQLHKGYKINLHDKADFIIDNKYIFEIGGELKNSSQIKNIKNSYLAIENIEVGFNKKIPLYLFGFLY